MGVADDPTALQPSLNDCLAAMLQQSEPLMIEVLSGLHVGTSASGSRRVSAFQAAPIKAFISNMLVQAGPITATFTAELTRLVYEGGGKDQAQAEPLRFRDLQLFADDQLDQSIELARAQQEVALAVDDSLPALDALVSTMLGWRTIQPGLNPVRPDVFVRALQATLAVHVPDQQLREILLTPAAGLMGAGLRKLYREMTDWLRSAGIEPAVPLGGRIQKGTGGSIAPVTDTVAKTLLTLDKLRKLLAGDFDQPKRPDFLHTVPASMSMLQEFKGGTEKLVKKLEERAKPPPAPVVPVDMLAEPPAVAAVPPVRIGQQLGEEVVRLMFDNLADDRRLLPALKRQLKLMEPAVHRLTENDSRFFSDRNHPARQMLDRITQRSLAFSSEADPGWPRFLASVEDATRWLDSKVIDADTFGELLDHLQEQWAGQTEGARQKREEAARALLHAEQRNLLAQKLAAEFGQMLEGLEVADFIGDFLKGAWAQVVAEAQLSCADGSSDPYGYRALVDDLIWSVQKTSAQRGRARRLVQMIPSLLQRLRGGLDRIGYPPELTQRFFDHLITLHRAAVRDGRDSGAQAAADAAPGRAFAVQRQRARRSADVARPERGAGVRLLPRGRRRRPGAGARRFARGGAAGGGAGGARSRGGAQRRRGPARRRSAGGPGRAAPAAAGRSAGQRRTANRHGSRSRSRANGCAPSSPEQPARHAVHVHFAGRRRAFDVAPHAGQAARLRPVRVVADRPVVDEALDRWRRPPSRTASDPGFGQWLPPSGIIGGWPNTCTQ
ncbi:DUF1631 family protein [Ramlibacter terrae]|uniref:DUF1631 family protein n=1 Tax=Ramlibacter terrae TaxID=2732511 RepID=A0ABX6P4Q8_9BURK|nr:DUF1631 family protein [Ramlibacter terrae]